MTEHNDERSPVPEDGILELIDPEDGTRHRFEVLEMIVVDGMDYVICAPVDGEVDEAYAFRLVTEEDQPYLEDIPNEEEWDMVARAWEEAQDEI